jgi:spore germination protein YaaH
MKQRIGTWWKFQTTADFETLTKIPAKLDFLSVAADAGKVPTDFVIKCQRRGWEVLHLIDRNSGAYDSEEAAAETVESIVGIALDGGFNGIDLDYEAQPAELRPAFSAFIERLSKALGNAKLKFSICVGYYKYKPGPYANFIDPEVVGKFCDEVRVMCYDQYFSPGKGLEPFDRLDCQGIGPTSSTPWARRVMEYWGTCVPKEKLIMGLPAYSTDYDARPNGRGRHLYSSLPPANNWECDKSWLWFEQVNVYRYFDESGAPRIFYASDADSTRAHLETASELGITGISFWEGRSVSPAMWEATSNWRDSGAG